MIRPVSRSISSCFAAKIHVMGAHENCLREAILVSTQNIYFCGEIRNISIVKVMLSGAKAIDSVTPI